MKDHHRALIYTMVLLSAADGEMTDSELAQISREIRYLPVFSDFDIDTLTDVTTECSQLISDPDGLEKALGFMRTALAPDLIETAYVLACDIAAADGSASQEELRLLEVIRHELDVERLIAAAIERAARARYHRA